METYTKTIKTLGGEQEVEFVEVRKSEIDNMNALILTLLDEDFVKKVQKRVEDMVENDPMEYVDEEGHVSLDEDNLIDQAIEHTFEMEYSHDVPTVVYEMVHEEFDFKILEPLEDMVKEVYNDTVEYNRDPLGYHGMKQSDFL